MIYHIEWEAADKVWVASMQDEDGSCRPLRGEGKSPEAALADLKQVAVEAYFDLTAPEV